jgi:uncharacterized protein YdeI (YjbR/CyaY-like superfamily)
MKLARGVKLKPRRILNRQIMMGANTNPQVDFYFNKAKNWQEALAQLRTLVLDCGLTEELKWGVPCYTYRTGNVLLLHVFKEYCAVLFFKGVLLSDPNGLLVQQTENTQATRQLRFSSAQQVREMEAVVRATIQEAIEVEKAGLEVSFKQTADYALPEEFQVKLAEVSGLREAFEGLTPGRQRAYLLYFSAAKQAKTRVARVEKYLRQILDGKGLDDE